MERATPKRLFVSMSKVNPAYAEVMDKFYVEGVPLPPELQAIRHEHVHYIVDLSKRGILWLGGPSVDSPISMNIFSVDSLEEARRIQQNDPYFVHGHFQDDTYFEWAIHLPFGMVSPAHKEKLEETFKECGIAPESL